MRKFWTILGHTFFSKLKTKAFLVSTIITVLFLLLVANVDVIIKFFNKEDTEIVLVQEDGALLTDPLAHMVAQIDDKIEFEQVTDIDLAKERVAADEAAALLVLSFDEMELPVATYYENKASESSLQIIITQQLQQLKVAMATEQAGVDEASLAAINEAIAFEKVALDESTKTDEELNQARVIVYLMLFLLYLAIIIYGQMIATDVATEKSSRVMEILISSASPVTHMFAKIFGVALLGLTQIGLFALLGFGLLQYKLKANTEVATLLEMTGITSSSASLYFYALLFFILGYLLYATIAAMLGSLVSRVEDVQQLILPMIFLVMIAFFIAMFGLSVPDASFITVSSYIPFFSPMIMFLRIGMLDIAFWEIALSVGILIGTIILLAIIGARIYRGGVLMYGPSRSLKDLKNAFQLSKKENK